MKILAVALYDRREGSILFKFPCDSGKPVAATVAAKAREPTWEFDERLGHGPFVGEPELLSDDLSPRKSSRLFFCFHVAAK